MFVLTVGLIIAVILLWSRLKQLDQRIAALESSPRQATIPVEPRVEAVPVPEALPAAPQRTVTIINRPVVPSVTEEPAEAPVPEPQPVLETSVPPPPPEREKTQPRTIGFEELFGSKLPIWAGGITLAVAGLFIVKYSIDAGLLSPAVRVVLGLLFAVALVAGAEFSKRWTQTAIDPRIAQALAGAGIATAYASILIATNLYGLIGPLTGFIGLALTTAAALGLALRFGPPAAVLGLVGGLAAPALVGESTGNIAPLTAYLALVIGGLASVGRKQRWMWLTASALIGGFGWGLLLIAFETLDTRNMAALASYTLLLALAVPMLLGGLAHEKLLKAGAGVMGAVQIALIVKQGGHGPLAWGFYGLLSVGAIILARMDRKLSILPPVALGIGLVTMLFWTLPGATMLALVAAGFVLLFAGPALIDIWSERGSLRDPIQAAVALGGTLIASAIIAPSDYLTSRQWSLLALAAALPLVISAVLGARKALPHRDPRFLALGIGAAALASIAAPDLAGKYLLPGIYAAGVAILVELWRRRPDLDYRGAIGVLLLATVAAIAESFARWLGGSLLTLAGEPLFVTSLPLPWRAVCDLIVPGAILTIAAWRSGALVPSILSRGLFAATGLLGIAGLFILYKQIFAIDGGGAFKDHGMLERVLLDQMLFLLGWAALNWRDRMAGLRELGLAVSGIALARVLLYHALLFDPLWRLQLVGAVPLANLLAPAFLFPLGWLWLAGKAEPVLAARFKLGITGIQMTLIGLFVAASLRQLFHGSLLAVGGVGQAEDIGRSLAAIALAIGFLRWGIWKRERPWRIASLVLMLLAVAKVFVVDTSGLEGLVRIASFVALGFSLIGIGWLYSRHLKSDVPVADGA
jgi:uncharacterized membrane protein